MPPNRDQSRGQPRGQPRAGHQHPPHPRQRRRRHRRIREERFARLLAAIEGEQALRFEHAVPRASRDIDVTMDLGVPSDAWGPLRKCLAHRTVLVEHYSRAPSIRDITRSLSKQAYLVEQWWHDLTAAVRRDTIAWLRTHAGRAIPNLLELDLSEPRSDTAADTATDTAADTATDTATAPSADTTVDIAPDTTVDTTTDTSADTTTDTSADTTTDTSADTTTDTSVDTTTDTSVDTAIAPSADTSHPSPQDPARPNVPLRPPILLMLTAGYPRQSLSSGIDLPPAPHPAIWQSERPLFGDILLVNLRGLPPDAPGCAALRLMVAPKTAAEARIATNALIEDRFMLQSTRNRIAEEIMNDTFPASHDERESLFQRARYEGKMEGRAALLDIIRPLLDDQDWQELSQIQDLDELRARAQELIPRR